MDLTPEQIDSHPLVKLAKWHCEEGLLKVERYFSPPCRIIGWSTPAYQQAAQRLADDSAVEQQKNPGAIRYVTMNDIPGLLDLNDIFCRPDEEIPMAVKKRLAELYSYSFFEHAGGPDVVTGYDYSDVYSFGRLTEMSALMKNKRVENIIIMNVTPHKTYLWDPVPKADAFYKYKETWLNNTLEKLEAAIKRDDKPLLNKAARELQQQIYNIFVNIHSEEGTDWVRKDQEERLLANPWLHKLLGAYPEIVSGMIQQLDDPTLRSMLNIEKDPYAAKLIAKETLAFIKGESTHLPDPTQRVAARPIVLEMPSEAVHQLSDREELGRYTRPDPTVPPAVSGVYRLKGGGEAKIDIGSWSPDSWQAKVARPKANEVKTALPPSKSPLVARLLQGRDPCSIPSNVSYDRRG